MSTPMMQQYNELKRKNPDTILLFRLGDFYEAFNEDAKEISKILNITLTGRGKGEGRKPMAGIPHHALKNYLKKLIIADKKVAIAEQLEEPQSGKLVDRDIVKIITAGTFTDEEVLDESENNYLAAIDNFKDDLWTLAYADLTTGEFKTTKLVSFTELKNELFRLHPNEILLKDAAVALIKPILGKTSLQTIQDSQWEKEANYKILLDHFKTQSLQGFGLDKGSPEVTVLGVILDYLKETQKTDLSHIRSIKVLNRQDYMNLDPATISSLELIWPLNNDNPKATLFGVLNECQTAMGQRKLRSWILHPLINTDLLQNRISAIKEALADPIKVSSVREKLNDICDLERTVSKLGTGSINARDLIALKTSLAYILALLKEVKIYKNSLLNIGSLITAQQIQSIQETIELLEASINDDPPTTIMEGDIIKYGYNQELDELKDVEKHGKEWLKELQRKEIERTGITSLKVKFNSVFGYYLEVSKSNLNKVPDNYIRKQTLVNAERFITEELKEWESKILNAGDKANQIEYEAFQAIKNEVSKHISIYQLLAEVISTLDVLLNFAHLARLHKYCEPVINNEGRIQIESGRHPVVERFTQERYIPNDLTLDKSQQIIILTGPNMSGKSTYIRQIALIALMAQIGSFVPAEKVDMTVTDRIFTRVGASDNLASGESTFMVEMNETANILNNATQNSLIILDEVGRGTSTYDGVAIAWSIVEYIHNTIEAKTLFATHYHELTDLEQKLDRIKNYNVDVIEEGDEIKFTRKVVPGSTDQSYGVHVAKMAGVPAEVTKRANQILMTLEQESMLEVKSIESELFTLPKEDSVPVKKDKRKKQQMPKESPQTNQNQIELL